MKAIDWMDTYVNLLFCLENYTYWDATHLICIIFFSYEVNIIVQNEWHIFNSGDWEENQ